MKRIFLTILLVAFLIGAMASCNASGKNENPPDKELGGLTDNSSKGLEMKISTNMRYYTVVGIGSCTDKDIVIPATYNGLPVRAIAAGAFKVVDNDTASLPKPAKKLRASATAEVAYTDDAENEACLNIESVTIPDGVMNIGDEAFEGCEKLANVEVNDLISIIGTDAFKDTAFYLDESNWENGVLYLENYLVAVRDGVETVSIRDGITNIANGALKDCASLATVTFPTSIKVVGDNAFENCTALTSVNLGVAGVSIGKSAFAGCTSLASVTVADETLPSVPTQEILDELPKVTHDNTLPETMFSWVSMTSYFMDNGVSLENRVQNFVYAASIGEKAFSGCTSLTSISIGSNARMFGRFVFENCTALESVSLANLKISGSDEYIFHRGAVSISTASFDSMFLGCTALKSATLPEGLKELTSTFSGCTALKSIALPSTVEVITYAFYGCTSLETVTFSGSLRAVLGKSFYECSSLTEAILPESTIYVGERAFYYCSSLGKISIPGVEYVGISALEGIAEGAVVSLGATLKTVDIDGLLFRGTINYEGTASQWNAISKDRLDENTVVNFGKK